MVTVIVAHKSRLVRQALAKALSLQKRITVVGDVSSGRDAAEIAEKLMPDVIIIDSVLPGLNSMLEKNLCGQRHGPEVVVFPGKSNGCRHKASHLTYDDDIDDLVSAVLGAAGKSENPAAKLTGRVHGRLTKREQEVLPLLADGLSNKQIARKLEITERTVKYHISNILRKLDLFSRTEAAVAFLKNSTHWAKGDAIS